MGARDAEYFAKGVPLTPELRELLAKPSTGVCQEHGLDLSLIVRKWSEAGGSFETTACALCVAGSWAEPVAAWDGHGWSGTDPRESWRREWCRHSNVPPEMGDVAGQRVDAVSMAMDRDDRLQDCYERLVWILLLEDPLVDEERLYRWVTILMLRRLQLVEVLDLGLDGVRSTIAGSRRRWERFASSLWDSMDGDLRGRVACLSWDAPLSEGRNVLTIEQTKIFCELADAAAEVSSVEDADIWAWTHIAPTKPLTTRQLFTVARWLVDARVDTSSERESLASPELPQPETWGPNAAKVRELIASLGTLDDTELLCLIVAGRVDAGERAYLDECFLKAAEKCSRLLIATDWPLLAHTRKRLERPWWRESWSMSIYGVVQQSCIGIMAEGHVEAEISDACQQPFREALQAAHRIREGGDASLTRARVLAVKDWGSLSTFVEAALDL